MTEITNYCQVCGSYWGQDSLGKLIRTTTAPENPVEKEWCPSCLENDTPVPIPETDTVAKPLGDPKKRYTAEDKKAIAVEYKNGKKKAREIAVKYEISEASLYAWVKSYYKPVKSRSITVPNAVSREPEPERKQVEKVNPAGLMSRKAWEEKRLDEIRQAIIAYLGKDMAIPEEWIREYNERVGA